MNPVGAFGLVCPDDNDVAAFALAMQCNAKAVEAALSGMGQSLVGYQQRPYLVVANANALNVSDSTGSVLPEGRVGEALTPGFTTTVIGAQGLSTSPTLGNSATWLPPGIYAIGTSVRWTVATPNSGTFRSLMIYDNQVIAGNAPLHANFSQLYVDTDRQSSSNFETNGLTAMGLIRVTDNTLRVVAGFAHGNTSSVIAIAAGAWRLWVTYLGTGVA